jgi:hypothetical protein
LHRNLARRQRLSAVVPTKQMLGEQQVVDLAAVTGFDAMASAAIAERGDGSNLDPAPLSVRTQ